MSRKVTFLGVAGGVVLALALTIAGCSDGGSSPTAPPDPIAGANANSSGGSSGNLNPEALASIDIEKRTNGVDADTGSGPSIPVGDPVTWSYEITNTGNETLTQISATDDREGGVTCPRDTLEGVSSMICTPKTGVAALGPYTNTVTVTAQAPSGPVEDSDNSAYTGVEDGGLIALDLEKRTNGEDADTETGPILLATAGMEEEVLWTYVVTNNSDSEAIDIEVMDTPEGLVNCPDDTLAGEGGTMECGPLTGSARPGQYGNTATATATIANQTITASDSSHYFGSVPVIAMNKFTDGEINPVLVPGCPVTWTYVLANEGNIDLEAIEVIDTEEGTANCPSTDLPEGGADMTCEITGIVDTVAYQNDATVTAQDPAGNPVFDDASSGYTVVNQPPICANAVASPAELWPPNHDLIDVTITNIEDVCERALSVRFDSVYQDEPINGTGDGDTAPDAVGVGTDSLQIRSERQGGGDGRVYYVDFTVTDPAGDGCSDTVMVMVPHDQSGDIAVDSGPPYYDSVSGEVVP